MFDPKTFDISKWLADFDIAAVPSPDDKLRECEFFFGMLSGQTDREKFRWLVSAFLNAAYSFFESSALTAYYRFNDAETAEPVEDSKALDILRRYVKVSRRPKKPEYVTTEGLVPLTQQLYEFRRKTTHHFPLSIMAAGPFLPADFHFGSMRSKGTPVLPLCRDVLALVRYVHEEIER